MIFIHLKIHLRSSTAILSEAMLKGEDENPSTRTKVHFSRRPQWMLPESQAEAHRVGAGKR